MKTDKTKPCPHCAGTVANVATKCPHCGGSLRTSSERIAFVIIALFVLLLIAGAVSNAKFEQSVRNLDDALEQSRRLH